MEEHPRIFYLLIIGSQVLVIARPRIGDLALDNVSDHIQEVGHPTGYG